MPPTPESRPDSPHRGILERLLYYFVEPASQPPPPYLSIFFRGLMQKPMEHRAEKHALINDLLTRELLINSFGSATTGYSRKKCSPPSEFRLPVLNWCCCSMVSSFESHRMCFSFFILQLGKLSTGKGGGYSTSVWYFRAQSSSIDWNFLWHSDFTSLIADFDSPGITNTFVVKFIVRFGKLAVKGYIWKELINKFIAEMNGEILLAWQWIHSWCSCSSWTYYLKNEQEKLTSIVWIPLRLLFLPCNTLLSYISL